MPLPGRGPLSPESRIPELQRLAAERGRGPVPVTIFAAPGKPEVIEQYESLGVERCIFMVPPASADVVLPKLDSYSEVMAKFS